MVKKSSTADLRAAHRKVFEASLIVSLVLVIAAFKFFPDVQASGPIEVIEPPPPIVLATPPVTRPETPPPPARPPVVIEAPPDEIIEDFPFDTGLNPNSNVPPPPPPVGGDEKWYEAVATPPEPADGYAALQALVVYPEMARKIGIEGTVVILAYVEKNGTVSRTEVVKGIGFGCDEAAAKAVEKTKFIPGLQGEKPVRVKIALQVRFKLRK
jgi:protein TonB